MYQGLNVVAKRLHIDTKGSVWPTYGQIGLYVMQHAKSV